MPTEPKPDNWDARARGFMAQYGFTDSYARGDLADLLRTAHASGAREAEEKPCVVNSLAHERGAP